jgi:glycosyltransferase involved in cell wall biosynthesis
MKIFAENSVAKRGSPSKDLFHQQHLLIKLTESISRLLSKYFCIIENVTPEALECCDFLHICMITREFPPESGGIGYYVLNLSKNLLAMGHKVTVMTRGTTARFTKEIISGIDVFKIPFFPFYPLHIWIHGWFVNSIFKSLEPRFDLVHLHSPLPPPIKTKLPTITTVHTSMKIDSKYHEVIDFFSFAEKMQSMLVYPAIEKNLLNNSRIHYFCLPFSG